MKRLIAGVVLGVGLTAMAHGAGDPAAGEQNAAVEAILSAELEGY